MTSMDHILQLLELGYSENRLIFPREKVFFIKMVQSIEINLAKVMQAPTTRYFLITMEF
jgi:hypothetical protein